MDDNKKWIYDSLKGKGVDLGSYDDYTKALGSEDSRKWVYDTAKNSGVDLGTYDDYNKAIGVASNPAPKTVTPKSDYVTGSGKDTQIFGVPYETYKHLSPESQSYYYQQAINKKKDDETKKIDEASQSLRGNIAEQRTKEDQSRPNGIVDKFSRLLGGGYPGNVSTIRPTDSDDVIAAENTLNELQNYREAHEDDEKGVGEIQKGINEAGRRLPETLSSIGTFGLSRLANGIQKARLSGSEDNELTKQASELYNRYTELNNLDESCGRDIASGALQSAEYVSGFAMGGALTKGATEGLGKIIASRLGGNLSAKAIGGAAEVIGNEIARTTVMPSTYSTAVDIMNQTGAGFPDAWGKAFTQGVIENFSEGAGEFIPGIGIANKTKIGRYFLDKTKGFRHISGIQGFPQEFTEEQIATVLHSIAGDGQGKWSDLIDPRNQLMTAGVLAVMQVPHVSIASGSYVAGKVGNKVQNYSINKAYNKNLVNLQEQFGGNESADSGEIVDFVNKSIDNARSGKDMDALLDYVASDENLTDNQRDAIAKYAEAYNAKAANNKGKTDAVSEKINADTEDIKANSDPSTWIYTEANRLVPNEVGEFVPVPGYIVGHIGDTPLWKPEGSGPDVQAVPLKPHEIQNVQSMPTQDVIDASSRMIQDQAKADDDFESKYDPQIQPPVIGSSFVSGNSQYEIVQQNPNGGWIANMTTIDEKGKSQTQVVEITNDDYYNAKQQELDAKENSNLSDLQQGNEDAPESEQSNVLQNNGDTDQKDNTPEIATQQEQQAVSSPQVIYKKDEKGNDTDEINYEAMPVENTINHLNSITGNDEATAKSIEKTYSKANSTYESAQKALDKIESEGVDYTDRKEVAAYQKAKDAVMSAKNRVNYWTNVKDEVQASRVQPGDKTAEAIRTMGDPVSGEELAASMLGNGNLPILFSDYKKETGYSNSEGRKMVGLFANKANGGMSVQEAGEKLMLADQENGTNFFDQNDPNAGRNAILDVLSQANTRGDLFNYIQSNREALAERERQAEYNAYSTWADENYHMAPEDYETYEEALPKYLADKALSDDEYNQFMYNFADEQLNNNENDNIGRAGQEIASDEQRGIQADGERSGEVLPEEQPLPTGRSGESETEPIQADENINNKDVTSQRSSSTGEITGDNVLNNGEESISSQSKNTDNDVRYNQEQELPADERLEQETSAGREENARTARRLGSYRQVRSGSGRNTNTAQEKELEDYAKEKGIWLDAGQIAENSEHKFRSGNEADVYLNKDGKTVTKVIDYSKYSKSPLDFIDNRILLFNKLFNDTPYAIVGFTKTDKGFSFVVEQPYIKGLPLESPVITGTVDALLAQQKRVSDYMAERFGMKPVGLDAFSDGEITIQDVHLRNVIQGEDGNLYVIDAVPSVKKQQSFVAPEYKGGDLLDYAEQVSKQKEVHDAGNEVNPNPTESQKEAGNYKKGHVKIDGLDITIENPKGTERSGVDKSGKKWSITMNNDYGYIRGTQSVDGDHIDVFLGPDLNSSNVYVVDQVNPDGSFDEHKVVYGFNSIDEAREAYLSNYEDGWKGLGNITEVSKEGFKKWIDSSTRKTKPFAEYKISQNDNQNNIGVQSNLREREESEQGKSVPATSEEKASTSGVLQTPEKVSDVPAITEEEYLASKGYGSQGIGEPALQKGKQKTSKQQEKIVENQAAKDKEYTDKRKELRKEYRQKVDSGELREPTTVEKLIKVANGSPDLESTQAARRSLEKRGIDWKGEEKRFRTGKQTDKDQAKSVSDSVKSISEKLNTPVKVINSIDDLPSDVRARVEKGHRIKGWYDPKTGEVVVYAPNAESAEDVNRTVLHEIVGHKGLRALFGDKFDNALQYIYKSLPKEVRAEIAQAAVGNYAGNTSIATEEYLAEQAEKNETPSWWNKVVSGIRDFLRGVGINVEMSDNDVKYLLWRSKTNLETSNPLSIAEDISMRNKLGVGEYGNRYRIDSTENEKSSDGTREAYEDKLNEKGLTGFQAKEAYQDSMLSLKYLQDVISDMDGKPVKSFENAYLAENRMSSISTREMEVFAKDYFRPLVEEVARMIKDENVSYRDITNYLIAKHGIERNQILAERDAEKSAIDSGAEKGSKDYNDVYNDQLERNLQNDYSGLTGLMKSLTDEKEDPTEFAKNLVSDFESKHNTDKIWKLINEATDKTLRKSYESGMISKDRYEEIKDRFKNYVPLRGWDETMADEVYNYLDGKRSPVNSVMKGAEGRTSLADDPIATIGNMAESTILEGNRNIMKQHFLNFVTNHPSDLATIRDVWYVKDNATDEMIPSYPNIPDNATPEEVSKAVDDHEQQMEELEKQGLAKRGRNGLDLRYKILPFQKSEHAVTVKRNGKEQVIYINANPRAAQALNGNTNPDVENNPIFRAIGSFNRALAKNFTTRNPAFVLSNLSRDLIFAHSAVAIKESPMYLARFSTNIPTSISTVFKGVRGIEDNSEAGKYFQEFLDNGGETGYANLRDVDRYKKMVQSDIKHLTKKDYFKSVRDGAELLNDFNRMAENVSRFNAYLTSRQEGKDVVESIKDAKEITVNFNKKGSGYKSLDPKQAWYSKGNVAAYSAGAMRNLFLFFNAGVQSLANFGNLAKRNAGKFGAVIGGFTAAGFMMPFINKWLMDLGGDGDDQDYYQNLTEWTRRNNLCIYIPYSKGDFVTIPLPIELRAFFGLGDLAYQSTIGNSDKKGTDIAFDAINQLTELLPLNPLGNNGDITSTVVPDALKPVWQVHENKDFTGRPIFKENAFNENMPEWTKTYKGNSKMLIKLAEWSNEIGGGDKYMTSDVEALNWNPAKLEHILEGYFGGMATTLNQTGKTLYAGVESAVKGEKSDDLTVSNAPVLNRFIKDASDDRSSFKAVREKFYNYLKEYEDTEKNLRGYTNEVSSGNIDYLQKLVDLQKSKDYQVYATFKALKKPLDKIRQLEKKVGEDNSEELVQQRNELMKIVVGELDKIK